MNATSGKPTRHIGGGICVELQGDDVHRKDLHLSHPLGDKAKRHTDFGGELGESGAAVAGTNERKIESHLGLQEDVVLREGVKAQLPRSA